MNALRISALFFLIVQTAAAQRPATASLQGNVAKSTSGEILSKATLELHSLDANPGPQDNRRVFFSASDNQGQFVFQDVPAGRYRLTSTRTGYSRAEYGQRGPNGPGLPITVAAGQKLRDLKISMTPTGAISGIITDNLGKPLPNATVQAVKTTYQNGRRLLTVMKSVRTNDLGEYRLFWLPAGPYYINVIVPGNRDFNSSGLVQNPNTNQRGFASFLVWDDPLILTRPFDSLAPEAEAYVPVYFPGTADFSAATIVNVRPETDIPGINISAITVRTASLKGVITNGVISQKPVQAQIALLSSNPNAPGTYAAASDPKDGTFAFPKVVPGSYVLLARLGNESFANASVELRERDVKEISVTLTPAFNLPGRMRFENVSPGSDITSLGIVLNREPAAAGQGVLTPTKRGIADVPLQVNNVSADGSFTVMNVPPGDYRIALAGSTVPPGSATQTAYVKAMRLGDADILDRVVHFDGPPEGALEIVIGTGTGSLEGRAMIDAQQPATASTVVLLPDLERRFRTDLYKTTVTDASGRFRLDGIPPGDYTAFVWEDVEPGAWQDPDFTRRFEDRGKSIHISEGARESMELTAIGPRL